MIGSALGSLQANDIEVTTTPHFPTLQLRWRRSFGVRSAGVDLRTDWDPRSDVSLAAFPHDDATPRGLNS